MKASLLPLILCPLVQGCVGFGVLKTQTEVIRDPVVSETPEVGSVRQRGASDVTNEVVYTSEWLEAHWGKPKSIGHTPDGAPDEVWTYRLASIWEGVVPIVLLPIPLVLPVARENVHFVLHDGRVISASETAAHMTGGLVGFGIGPCGGGHFGAFSLSHMDD